MKREKLLHHVQLVLLCLLVWAPHPLAAEETGSSPAGQYNGPYKGQHGGQDAVQYAEPHAAPYTGHYGGPYTATHTGQSALQSTGHETGQNTGKYEGRILMLAVPRLSFLELSPGRLDGLPNIREIIHAGGIGSMNVRTPERGLEDAYLSIGAGAPAVGRYEIPALQRKEVWQGAAAGQLYRRLNGGPEPSADILIPEARRMLEWNMDSNYASRPGLLGDLLEQNGVGRYVFGNSDLGFGHGSSFVKNRHAALMLMNGHGTVSGTVGDDMLRPDPGRPYGAATDYAALAEALASVPARSVALAELGDLARLHSERERYTAERFSALEREILREADAFVGNVREGMRPGDQLIVFSPLVNEEAERNKRFLAPIIYYREGMGESLAQSATTRQPGIVSMYDLAPFILAQFGIQAPAEMIGRTLEWTAHSQAVEWLARELDRVSTVYLVRLNVLYPFVSYQVAVLIVSLIAAVFGWHWGRPALKAALKTALLSILAGPAAMLALGYVSGPSWFMAAVFIVLWAAVSFAFACMPVIPASGAAGGLNAFLILLDGFLGSPGMSRSILGYDPMIGARYYGIGNEFMGVLIGALILAASCFMHLRSRAGDAGWRLRLRKWGIALGFAVTLYYLAAPGLGTNAGGAISATVAFGVAWLRMFVWKRENPLSLVKLGGLFALLGAVSLAVLWAVHMALPWAAGQESHIGRAMRWLAEGRFDQIGALILRKLEMNLHLIGVSAWSKVLLAGMLVIAVIVLRPRGVFRKWQQQYPFLMHGFSASAIGAITALLVNDSGIVSCATIILFIAIPMLLFKLDTAPGPSGPPKQAKPVNPAETV